MSCSNNSTLRNRTFDRLKKSILGEPSDAHAVFHFYTFPFYQFVTGVDLDEFFHNPKVAFETELECIEKLEKCGSFFPDLGATAECSGLGGKVRFDKEGFISVAPSGISSFEEAIKLKPADPWGDNYMRRALEQLQYFVENAPKDIKVNAPICMAPFTVCAQLRGISDFCLDTLEDPDFVEALLDVAVETDIRYMKECEKILGRPLHHLFLSDDLSSFLSLSGFEEWVVPTYEKIFKEFPHSQLWLHNDAKADHIAKGIADVGFQAWQYAPSISPQYAMEKTEGKVSLFGGLSPLQFQKTSAQETYEICMETLKSFEGNNKYVLGVGGSVNQIPVENLLAMLHAADDYAI